VNAATEALPWASRWTQTSPSTSLVAIRRRPPKVRELEARGATWFLTTPVLYEILAGILEGRSTRGAAEASPFLARLPIPALDEAAPWRPAQLRAELRRRGRRENDVYVTIAGIASAGGHSLLARDFAEIARTAGLRAAPY
jgi:predicted nucleic acid-binding protein